MAFPLIPVLAGAGLGLGKTIAGNMAADEERKRQAAIARWSPWTGMQAKTVGDQDLFGNLLTGAAGGAVLGQAMNAAPAAKGATDVASGMSSAANMPVPSPDQMGQDISAATGGDLMASKSSPYSLIGMGGASSMAPQFSLGSAGALNGAALPSSWMAMDQYLKLRNPFGTNTGV